jgi:hypothetical protein
MDTFELAKSHARKLHGQVVEAGYAREGDFSQNVHTVVEVLEKVLEAESTEDIPRQVGGDHFFQAVAVEKELGLEGFSSEFRKIHVVIGRDIELERRTIEAEEAFIEKHGADVARQLDESYRPD